MWREMVDSERRTYRNYHHSFVQALKRASSSSSLLGSTRSPSSRPSSRSSGSRRVEAGDHVRISGMSRRRELNGMRGNVVQAAPDEHGRVLVELGSLSGSQAGFSKTMRIAVDRLRPQDDASSTTSQQSFETLLPNRSGLVDANRLGIGIMRAPQRSRSSGELGRSGGRSHSSGRARYKEAWA